MIDWSGFRACFSRSNRIAWAAGLLIGALALVGCATPPPPPPPPKVLALPPAADGPLATAEAALVRRLGEGWSGFRPLSRNDEALAWRLALIDAARQSLDLQYYVWFGDVAGQLLMSRLVAAADRGVRVRLLFDDLNTLLHDMSHVELRDATLREVDRHPNVEIRVFNGWHARDLLGRTVEAVWDFQRLNRRMHNKQMVADNRIVILGGRNIGDEYFGLHHEFSFHDLDVLGLGPAARQASAVFDRYWNSEWVRRLPLEARGTPSTADREALQRLASDPRGQRLLTGQRSWAPELTSLERSLHPGRSAVHTDSPSRAPGVRNHVPQAFRALMQSAQREVLISNAYIIPDAAFIGDLAILARRGVTVRILTNSLASHDVPAVNSHYERWRRSLLDSGVSLHELRADPQFQRELVDTAPVRAEFVGLHTKAMVIDRRHSFVGSMNLDPRSEVINAEMGIVIDSPPLADTLAASMLDAMDGRNSWQVTVGDDDALRWTSDTVTLSRQPARSAWQRVENLFFKLFPPSLY